MDEGIIVFIEYITELTRNANIKWVENDDKYNTVINRKQLALSSSNEIIRLDIESKFYIIAKKEAGYIYFTELYESVVTECDKIKSNYLIDA